MIEAEFLATISRIKQISEENKEENSIRGLQVDAIPNSPNGNHECFMTDSRENY